MLLRHRQATQVIIASLVGISPVTEANAATEKSAPLSAWAILAQDDLQAIHDVLEANHPGPVDPVNPAFRDWLESGLVEALHSARSASGYSDYKRALLFYTNGFRDTHIAPSFRLQPVSMQWPGFLVRKAAQAQMRLVGGEYDGATLTGCDGKSSDQMMKEAVDPFYWNNSVPHQRDRFFPLLFMRDNIDQRFRYDKCTFSRDGKQIEAQFNWRNIATDRAKTGLEAASNTHTPKLGLRKLEGLWFLSIPSFNFSGDEEVAKYRRFLADVQAHLPDLRREGFVLDVRGNRGGNSAWGVELVRLLWGGDWSARIESSFDGTVDWRASPANIDAELIAAEQAKRDGLPEVADYRQRVADLMKAALEAVRSLGWLSPRHRSMEMNRRGL